MQEAPSNLGISAEIKLSAAFFAFVTVAGDEGVWTREAGVPSTTKSLRFSTCEAALFPPGRQLFRVPNSDELDGRYRSTMKGLRGW